MRDLCGQMSRHRILRAVPVIALAAFAAGCSAGPLSNILPSLPAAETTSANASATTAATPPTDVSCPSVDVRQGASTMAISAKPGDDSPLNLRYQVGIGQTARECKVVGTNVTMRVGVQGRVVMGPAGAAGEIDVPVRLAVVREGPEPKTIATKLQRVKVTVPSSDTNVSFTLIEEDLSFPMPAGGDIDNYIVYVGFDPHAVREPARPRRSQPPRRNAAG